MNRYEHGSYGRDGWVTSKRRGWTAQRGRPYRPFDPNSVAKMILMSSQTMARAAYSRFKGAPRACASCVQRRRSALPTPCPWVSSATERQLAVGSGLFLRSAGEIHRCGLFRTNANGVSGTLRQGHRLGSSWGFCYDVAHPGQTGIHFRHHLTNTN